MVRVNENSLIIEINCNNNSYNPLELLGYIQVGIIDSIKTIDHIDNNSEEVSNAYKNLGMLLKEIMISPDQLGLLQDNINQNETLLNSFNKKR